MSGGRRCPLCHLCAPGVCVSGLYILEGTMDHPFPLESPLATTLEGWKVGVELAMEVVGGK